MIQRLLHTLVVLLPELVALIWLQPFVSDTV